MTAGTTTARSTGTNNSTATNNKAAAPTQPARAGVNVSVVRGRLSSDPTERELRSGSLLVGLEVTVSVPDGRDETVPVACFDPPIEVAKLAAGEEVVVVGRVRRRFFGMAGATASRTEIVASEVVPTRRKRAAERALAGAAGELGAG